MIEITEELLSQLTRQEGYRQYPYKCTSGKLTIGIGRNIEDRGITKEEAEYLLHNDIIICIQELTKNYPWCTGLNGTRKQVLINMCFNMGIVKLSGFKKMLLAMEEGDYKRAAVEAMDSHWAIQVGSRANELAEMIRNG